MTSSVCRGICQQHLWCRAGQTRSAEQRRQHRERVLFYLVCWFSQGLRCVCLMSNRDFLLAMLFSFRRELNWQPLTIGAPSPSLQAISCGPSCVICSLSLGSLSVKIHRGTFIIIPVIAEAPEFLNLRWIHRPFLPRTRNGSEVGHIEGSGSEAMPRDVRDKEVPSMSLCNLD